MFSSVRFKAMRHLILAATLSAGAAGGSVPVLAEEKRIEVTLDQAKVVKLPPNAQTLIIGNPIVADVTVLKSRNSMVLTGKGFGVTNMIALDSQGALVDEVTIEVTVAKDKVLVLQRGLDRESYSCVPNCMPVVAPGDASAFTSSASTSITTRNSLSGLTK